MECFPERSWADEQEIHLRAQQRQSYTKEGSRYPCPLKFGPSLLAEVILCTTEGCTASLTSTHLTINAQIVPLAVVREELFEWLKASEQVLHYGSYFPLKKRRNDSVSSSVKKWYGLWSVWHCIERVICQRTKKEKAVTGIVYFSEGSTQQAATNCEQLNYGICCYFKGRGREGCGGMSEKILSWGQNHWHRLKR